MFTICNILLHIAKTCKENRHFLYISSAICTKISILDTGFYRTFRKSGLFDRLFFRAKKLRFFLQGIFLCLATGATW